MPLLRVTAVRFRAQLSSSAGDVLSFPLAQHESALAIFLANCLVADEVWLRWSAVHTGTNFGG